MKKILEKITSLDRKFLKEIGLGILAVLIILAVIFGAKYFTDNGKTLAPDKVKTMAENYINANLLDGKTTIKIDELKKKSSGVYEFKFTLQKQQYTSYITTDGKFLFPTGIEISTSTDEKKVDTTSEEQAPSVTKNDKPKVELFVMSYCPYGTQIEKGIIPVVQALGDKIDFKLKFVNYAMHEQKELTENLRQYCVNKTQPAKFLPYLSCFLKAGDATACLKSTGVEQTSLNTCVASTDTQYKITEQFTKKENWNGNFPPFGIDAVDNVKYNIQGSPTLIINGVQTSSERDSASLLKTICSAFGTQPGICTTAKLSTATPAPGFGEATQTTGTAASCDTN